MKHRISYALALALISAPAAAQTKAPAVQSTGFHNVHLRVADPAAATEWYIKYLGATKAAPPFQAAFGRTQIAFVRATTPQPSQGSVVDHIGISFPDLAAKMKEFEAAGAKIVQQPTDVKGLFKFGYIEDPWGVKIEVMQDPQLLGFHHVHLSVADPAATLAWFQEQLGGERSRFHGLLDGLKFGTVWLLAAGSKTPVEPSANRAIMSLAVDVASVDESAAALRDRGVKQVTPPSQAGTVRYAFFEDAQGVRIELVTHQRP